MASMDGDSDGVPFCQGWTDRGGSGEIRGSPRHTKAPARPGLLVLGSLGMRSSTTESSTGPDYRTR